MLLGLICGFVLFIISAINSYQFCKNYWKIIKIGSRIEGFIVAKEAFYGRFGDVPVVEFINDNKTVRATPRPTYFGLPFYIGKKVYIYSNPQEPSHFVIESRFQILFIFLILVVLFFLIFTLLLYWSIS